MKKVFKIGCGGFIALILLGIIIGMFSDDETNQNATTEPVQVTTEEVETTTEPKETAEEEPKEDDVPREYRSALKKAQMYAETMYMSKAGIYDQLISEYGEAFPKEAAQYAIDNIEHKTLHRVHTQYKI